MTTRLGLFSTENRTKAVDPVKCQRAGFFVKLARLRKVGIPVKVLSLKQVGRAFWCIGRQDRRVNLGKAMFAKELVVGPNDAVTNPHQRVWLAGTQPQMTVIKQKVDSVFLVANWVVNAFADQFDVFNLDFVAKLGTSIFMNLARYPKTAFLTQFMPCHFKHFWRYVIFPQNALEKCCPVTQLQESDLTTGTLVSQPNANPHAFVDVLWRINNVDGFHKKFLQTM